MGDMYDSKKMDELRGEKGNRLREFAHAHGCLLLTPEDHWVLCEQIHSAIQLIEKEGDPLNARNILRTVMNQLEEDWKTGALET